MEKEKNMVYGQIFRPPPPFPPISKNTIDKPISASPIREFSFLACVLVCIILYQY
jgi:hypothetical protein